VAEDRSAAEEGDDMRIRAGLVLGLLLALGMAGCGGADDDGGGGGDGVATAGGPGSATSTTKPDGRSEREVALEFARCMRENGVPDFPDPQVSEGGEEMRLSLPEGADKEKVDAAHEKCKRYLPNGGEPPKADPRVVEQLRKFSQCMRANGVPKFPDPTESGLEVDGNELGMGPGDPTFDAAEKVCAEYQPAPPEGGQGPSTDSQTGSNP
jgi:hypothetical protein